MAQTIPCDICQEAAANFLVMFKPKAEIIGLDVGCVGAWGESIARALQEEGVGTGDNEEEVFKVTLIPDGEEMDLTVVGALAWAEVIVQAIDAQAAASAAGEGVEPINTPAKASRARKARKGRQAAAQPAQEVTDEEWEESGAQGRPPLSDGPAGPEGEGEGLEETEAQAASDR